MSTPQLSLWPDDPHPPPRCGEVPGVVVAVVLTRRELERGLRDWLVVAFRLTDGREPSISRAWADPEPRIVRRVLSLVDGRPERLAGVLVRCAMTTRTNREGRAVMAVADVVPGTPVDRAALQRAGVPETGGFFDFRDGLPPDGDPRWRRLPPWLRRALRTWWPGSEKGGGPARRPPS